MRKVLQGLLLMIITVLSVSAVGCRRGNNLTSESPTSESSASESPALESPAWESPASESPASGTDMLEPTQSPFDPGDGAQTVLYQLGDTVKNNQMMSYVIYTKDKKLILIDGGYDWNSDRLIALAKELTGQAVPVVDAWFLSHCHGDHINAFSSIMSSSSPKLQVKKVYYNFPSKEFIQQYASSSMVTYDKFETARKKLSEDQLHIVEQGERIEIGSVLVEVLLTPDERFTANALNDSSVALRMTIEGQRVMFLGDLGPQTGGRLRQAIQDNPTCDIVQMAHHGSNGIIFSIYRILKPKVCLWPTPDWLWENRYMGSTQHAPEFNTVELYEYMKEMGVTKHYVAKNQIQKLTFPVDL